MHAIRWRPPARRRGGTHGGRAAVYGAEHFSLRTEVAVIQKACLTRLTNDRLSQSVYRVPRRPPDDDEWTIRLRQLVAANIRDNRRQQNLTQEELYLAAGISRSALQDIESGHGNPKLVTLLRVAWVLNMHVTDLLREPEV